jgi:glycosyltransferase involved in cell wall biosynthesis
MRMEPMLRILLFTHSYPPVISGVSITVQKVARAMVRRGHQVAVVTASDRGVAYQDQDQGVELLRVRSAPNPFWSEGRLPVLSYQGLREIVDEVQPDVINTHDSGVLGVQLYRLEHEKGHVPELLTCHFLPQYVTYYAHVGDVIEGVVEEITWKYTIRMINGFNHVIFPTETQQQAFIEKGLATASSVVSNGLDTSRYDPESLDGKDVVAQYKLPPRPRILVVGRLAKDKKVDILIRAMRVLKTTHQAHLLLVGRGDDRERLQDLAASLDLEDRVRFLGFVPEEDLPALYRQADIFAIASDVEVQSIPTLQAAATGLAIVAAAAGALPELVRNNKNGYLVPPNDPHAFARAFREIIDNPEKAKKLGRASLEIGRQHAEEHTFEAYERIYREYSRETLD